MMACSSKPRLLVLAACLLPGKLVLAQAPVITSIVPAANANAIPRTTALEVTFSQPLTAASGNALQVFSSQRGGRRTSGSAPATVIGSTLRYAPTTYPFMPGELISYTISTAAGSGGSLVQPRVGQFTAAAGAGTGSFVSAAGVGATVGYSPESVRMADVDGDGDLDLVAANQANFAYMHGTVSIRLNNGRGVFSGTQEVSIGNKTGPKDVAVGDVDGDGDLDLLTANGGNDGPADTVSVRLNNGSGIYSGTQEVKVGPVPRHLVLGDIDGDGDLDFITANNGLLLTPGTTLSIRLNNGSGIFTGTQELTVGMYPGHMVLGDIDNDGDLDLLIATHNSAGSSLSSLLNSGSGSFSSGQTIAVGSQTSIIDWAFFALADIDGDGDLDLVTPTSTANEVKTLLNNGSGTFGTGTTLAVSPYFKCLTLGDVDGDGDLDLVTAHHEPPSRYSVDRTYTHLNNGNGTFSTGAIPPTVIYRPSNIYLADLDGDLDLDLVQAAQSPDQSVEMRLNNGTSLLAVVAGRAALSLAVFPNPARTAATLTGASPYASLTMHDVLGQVVFTTTTDASGTAHLALDAKFAAGIYLVRCGTATTRILLE